MDIGCKIGTMKFNSKKILLNIAFIWLSIQSALVFHETFTEHQTPDNCELCQFQDRSSDDSIITINDTFLFTHTFSELKILIIEEFVIFDVLQRYHSRAPPTNHT